MGQLQDLNGVQCQHRYLLSGMSVLQSAKLLQKQLLELCLHQNRSCLSWYIWLEKFTPIQVKGEGYLFLGPPSGLTQALSDCSAGGVELTCFTVSQLDYSVLCDFLGNFALHILATEPRIVSGCRGPHFVGTVFICHFCLPCFSLAQSQALPYPPPGCGKSRDVMRSRGRDISK